MSARTGAFEAMLGDVEEGGVEERKRAAATSSSGRLGLTKDHALAEEVDEPGLDISLFSCTMPR